MKTVGDDDAFPHKSQVGFSLTKREYFAALAMQTMQGVVDLPRAAAYEAVKYADALIEALNAKEGET
jgi:hypothetical protein